MFFLSVTYACAIDHLHHKDSFKSLKAPKLLVQFQHIWKKKTIYLKGKKAKLVCPDSTCSAFLLYEYSHILLNKKQLSQSTGCIFFPKLYYDHICHYTATP